MPALAQTTPPSSTKVLLTGGTGYIGQWILRTLLGRGYTVRAVVRSSEKEQGVRDALTKEGDHERLEFVIVEDLANEGAFDEAVKGVDAIVHVASPLPPRSAEEDPNNTIRPAVQGSLGLLNSALKYGTNLKRIAFTSSFGTVFTHAAPGTPTPVIFSENDWNTEEVKKVQEEGSRDPVSVYRASKVLAEKAIWNWYEDHKSSISWDVTTLLPPMVYGPSLTPATSPFLLRSTALYFYFFVFGSHAASPIPITKGSLGPKDGNVWADVRDVAEAHVRSLEREEAGGERLLTSAGPYIFQEWIDVVHKVAPTIAGLTQEKIDAFPKGHPELTANGINYLYDVDYSKEKRILGVEHRSKEELIRDLLEHGVQSGWL